MLTIPVKHKYNNCDNAYIPVRYQKNLEELDVYLGSLRLIFTADRKHFDFYQVSSILMVLHRISFVK